jgi:hypothetical protein
MARILALMFVLMLASGCSEEQICGGPCTYAEYPGTATVVSVSPDTSTGKRCDSSVIVVYDFSPSTPGAPSSYRFPMWPDTGRTLEIVESPPLGWTVKEGLTVGSKHRCIRTEIISGTCAPLVFEFPDIDVSDWPEYCD